MNYAEHMVSFLLRGSPPSNRAHQSGRKWSCTETTNNYQPDWERRDLCFPHYPCKIDVTRSCLGEVTPSPRPPRGWIPSLHEHLTLN